MCNHLLVVQDLVYIYQIEMGSSFAHIIGAQNLFTWCCSLLIINSLNSSTSSVIFIIMPRELKDRRKKPMFQNLQLYLIAQKLASTSEASVEISANHPKKKRDKLLQD